MNDQRLKLNWVAIGSVGTLLAGVAAVITVVIILFRGGGDSSPSSSTPEPADATSTSEPVTERPKTTATSDESSTRDVPEPPSASTSPAQVPQWQKRELTIENATETQRCKWQGNTGYSWDATSPIIGGQPYGWGFACPLRVEAASGYVDFLVPDGANILSVQVGLDDRENCTSSVSFVAQNAFTGDPIKEETAQPGTATPLNVAMDDITKVRLLVRFAEIGVDPWDERCIASWGEPVFLAD